MDKQKILIMNLAKGRIGEENSALLGAMMITKIQIAAMSRVDIPEEQRNDFYLYVDEFQNFATDSFAGILSEARKYRLCLTMAHQYFEQLGDVVKAAVFGNVGTMIVFRVGATDAAELELEFAPQFLPADIVNLKKYTFCLRLMVDGVATEPFSGIGLPPATGATANHEKVIKVSRERYARPQTMVEDRIIRWSGVEINRPGVTNSVTNADGTVNAEDLGDDNMDWPEPTISVDTSDDVADNDNAVSEPAASGSIQLETAAQNQSAYVSAAGFIPGEQPATTTPAPVVKTAAPVPVVRLEPTSPGLSAVGSDRPKISFIVPVETVSDPAVPATSLDQVDSATQTVQQPRIAESADSVSVAAIPKPVLEPPVTIPSMTQKVVPAEPVTSPSSVVPSITPSISLQSLKQGTAPQVKFSAGGQPRSDNVTPNPSHSQTPLTDEEQQRRKRKRKRKRGGGGGGNSNTNGFNQNTAVQPRPQQSVPPANDAFPSPIITAPKSAPVQPSVQPKLQPVAPKSAPSNDPNKVSWGDVLQ